ncbi:MAG: hypothetical protein ACLQKA_01555 [Bryobacteraceae bacterium]
MASEPHLHLSPNSIAPGFVEPEFAGWAPAKRQEGSAYGAALLALAGTGACSSVPEVCRAAIRETESVDPAAADAAFYARAHRVYQAFYPALKPLYGQIAELG